MKQGESTRKRIIEAANRLFYQRGYVHTSISDIVEVTGLSKGNITYHFKSKDDILCAVIDMRLARARDALSGLETKHTSPMDRLNAFIASLMGGKSELSRYGCPHGTLACELGKDKRLPGALYRRIFDEMRAWLSKQFMDLTNASKQEAESMAMDLLTRAQGICVFSVAYQDEFLFETEICKLRGWINSLVTPKAE